MTQVYRKGESVFEITTRGLVAGISLAGANQASNSGL